MKLISKKSMFSPCFVFFLFLLVVAILIAESSYPHMMKNNPIGHFDKIIHFVMFGFVASLFAHFLNICGYEKSWKIVVLSALAAVLVGAINEYVQSFTPGRHVGLDDLLADTVGAFAFLTVWKIKRSKSSVAQQ